MPTWREMNETTKRCFEFAWRIIEYVGKTIIATFVVYHLWNALWPGNSVEEPVPAVFRGMVRTTEGTPVRLALLRLEPSDGAPLLTIETNEAGYFEAACPAPGKFNIEVQLGFTLTPAKTLTLSECEGKLYEI